MTEMVTSGSMSGAEKRSDGPLGESASERSPLALGAAGPGRHRASPRLYQDQAIPLSPITRMGVVPLRQACSRRSLASGDSLRV
jgi:hypothetical protein